MDTANIIITFTSLSFFTGFIFLVLKQFFIQYETWLLIPAVTIYYFGTYLKFPFLPGA